MTRLTEKEVDELADKLELPVAKDYPVTFASATLPTKDHRKLGLMRVEGYPSVGFRTSISFGLAHESFTSSNFPDRIELIQGCQANNWDYERVQVEVVNRAIQKNELPKPGTVYRDIINHVGVDSLAANMPHALIIYPYLWQRDYYSFDIGEKKVWILQVVPIYDNERAFIAKNGYGVFEELLDYFGMQFHDLTRMSYVDM